MQGTEHFRTPGENRQTLFVVKNINHPDIPDLLHKYDGGLDGLGCKVIFDEYSNPSKIEAYNLYLKGEPKADSYFQQAKIAGVNYWVEHIYVGKYLDRPQWKQTFATPSKNSQLDYIATTTQKMWIEYGRLGGSSQDFRSWRAKQLTGVR